MDSEIVIVGAVSDDPFAIDVAYYFGQRAEIADLIACKEFANTEFCPRFISDEADFSNIGNSLRGRTVVIVTTCCGGYTRNSLVVRTCLIARAAKDNGADRVVLVEPDLFFSAQDRGPRREHGERGLERKLGDMKKFDGQAFSALLHAQLMKVSGVDAIVTIHNHSTSVQKLCGEVFAGQFFNLTPAELYADYLLNHGVGRPGAPEFVVCAPDDGAAPFVQQVHGALVQATGKMLLPCRPELLLMNKIRSGERQVTIAAAPESPVKLDNLCGKEVVVFDDMVRTGSTIVECCKVLKHAGASRVVFVVTHFYSSEEVKENLNHNAIDEIITANTLPAVLNRDMQGRLRRKMLVLKIEKWVVNFLQQEFGNRLATAYQPPYSIDVSSKNPRWMPSQSVRRVAG